MPSINVVINGLAGPVTQVTLSSEATVSHLKRAIEAKEQIPRKRQRLLYRDADLRNGFTLSYLAKGHGIYSSGLARSPQQSDECGDGDTTLQMSLIKRSNAQVDAITAITDCDRLGVLDYLDSLLGSPCEDLLDDADVMTSAIQKNAKSMEYASQRLRQDSQFVLRQVALCAYWLDHADESLISDKKFVMSAVGLNGYALKGAGNFRSDRDVVQAALKRTGRALEYASPELQADLDIVRFALKKDGQALEYAAPTFKSNRELVLTAVRRDGRALHCADESLRADKEVVSEALGQNTMAVQWVAEPLRSQRRMKKLLEEEDQRHERHLAQLMAIIQNRTYESDSE